MEAVSNVGLDIGSLLFEIDPRSQDPRDQAALAVICDRVHGMMLALDEVVLRLDVRLTAKAEADSVDDRELPAP